MIQSQSRVEQEQKDMKSLLSTFTENIDDQQSQSFSQDSNIVPKKEIKRRNYYSNTKVKTRNLLTVFYRRFNQSDFNKKSFIVDILSFLVQHFNPVNLDIKLDTDKERETIIFLWDKCIPNDFVQFIYKQNNYNQISRPSLTYQKPNTIVKE